MSNRTFTNHDGHFVLIEETGWIAGLPVNWCKTHIILTKYEGELGMQIVRFYGEPNPDNWELASNPYAGVYLTPEEWALVFETMNSK